MKIIKASALFGEEPLISDEFKNRYSNLFNQTVFQDEQSVTRLRRSVDRHYKTAPITYLTKPMSDCRSQTFRVKTIVKIDKGTKIRRKVYKINQEETIRLIRPTYSNKIEGVCRIQERFMNGENAVYSEGPRAMTSRNQRNCIVSVTRYRQAFPDGDKPNTTVIGSETTHRDILLCCRLRLRDISVQCDIDDLPNNKDSKRAKGVHPDKYTVVSVNAESNQVRRYNWHESEKLDSRMILMMRTHVSDNILKTGNNRPQLTQDGTGSKGEATILFTSEFSLERKQSSEGVLKNTYGDGTMLENVVTRRTFPNTVVFGGPVNVQYDDLSIRLTEGVYIVKGEIPTDAKVNVVNARYQNL